MKKVVAMMTNEVVPIFNPLDFFREKLEPAPGVSVWWDATSPDTDRIRFGKAFSAIINPHSFAESPKYKKLEKQLIAAGLIREADSLEFRAGCVSKYRSIVHNFAKGGSFTSFMGALTEGDVPTPFRVAALDIYMEVIEQLFTSFDIGAQRHGKKTFELINTLLRLDTLSEAELEARFAEHIGQASKENNFNAGYMTLMGFSYPDLVRPPLHNKGKKIAAIIGGIPTGVIGWALDTVLIASGGGAGVYRITLRLFAQKFGSIFLNPILRRERQQLGAANSAAYAHEVKQHLETIPTADRTLYISLILLSSTIATPLYDIRSPQFYRIVELLYFGGTLFGNLFLAPQNLGMFPDIDSADGLTLPLSPNRPSFILPDTWYRVLSLAPVAYHVLIAELMHWEKLDPQKNLAQFSKLLDFVQLMTQNHHLSRLGLQPFFESNHSSFSEYWPIVSTFHNCEERIKSAIKMAECATVTGSTHPEIKWIRRFFSHFITTQTQAEFEMYLSEQGPFVQRRANTNVS